MQRVWTIFGAALIAIACLVTHESISAPLDVTNTTPRRIEVRFEISPPDEPGSLDRRWSDVRVAYLEPEPDTQALRIRIPAEVIEA